MSLSEEAVQKWLDSNPTFLSKYISKAPKELVDNLALNNNKDDAKFTSVAKNVLASKLLNKYVRGETSLSAVPSKDSVARTLQRMNETEVFMELVKDIASELDVNVLCHKILRNVSLLTKSDRGSLFLARGGTENKYLVSKLFDVTQTSTLEESLHTEDNEIKVPFGRGIAGHVASTKEEVNIKEAYDDPRFNQAVDKKTGYRTHSILCLPILNNEEEVIGVAQIINKVSGVHEFTQRDVEIFRKYLTFCGIGIMNAQLFEMSVKEYQRNQLLLNLARGVFEEQTNLQKLVQKIMLESQQLLKCERCSVYMLEDFSEQMSFDLDTNDEEKKPVVYDSVSDVKFSTVFDLCAKKDAGIEILSAANIAKSKNTEISRLVVFDRKVINIPDLDDDSRFGNEHFVDDCGFRTKSVLCMPIYNSKTVIIGVTQFINKVNRQPFNENDENIIEAFSIFTGLGIHNCVMYESVCKLMAKQKVALEVLSYHATASDEETMKLAQADLPTAEEWGLYTFEFDDILLDEFDTCKAVIRMFCEMGAMDLFNTPYDVLCRWTLSVRKNYRQVTYHNWRHAFNVFQSMFTILFTGDLSKHFDSLEMYGLLAACLCHDLDHRGTNNAFQVKAESPLATLYSTSVMEHHHFDHCIMILNSEGNNIFMSLNQDDYRRVLNVLEHAILSTDLALYFKKRGDFKTLMEKGVRDYRPQEHKDVLTAMMMTACDVAAICKPWEVQFRTAQLVASEFFEQGDMERDVLGQTPMAMMDRSKVDELPKMQVGFIDAICLQVYKLFQELTPAMAPMYEGVLNNRKNWQELADIEAAKGASNNDGAESSKPTPTNDTKKEPLSKPPIQVNDSGKKGKTFSLSKKVNFKKPKSKICSIL